MPPLRRPPYTLNVCVKSMAYRGRPGSRKGPLEGHLQGRAHGLRLHLADGAAGGAVLDFAAHAREIARANAEARIDCPPRRRGLRDRRGRTGAEVGVIQRLLECAIEALAI